MESLPATNRYHYLPKKITICWMNNSAQLVVVYYRQTDSIFQKISCLFFSRDFWYTIDGYTHAHFVMTGTSGTHDGNGCRLNIHIEHSLSTTMVSPDGAGWMAARGANLGCGLKSRVTKRCTGREEVGKMTHQPTVTKNYKNTQRKFDSTLGSCDVSVAPRSVRLSSSSGTQLLLLSKDKEVPLFFFFLNYPPYVFIMPGSRCSR